MSSYGYSDIVSAAMELGYQPTPRPIETQALADRVEAEVRILDEGQYQAPEFISRRFRNIAIGSVAVVLASGISVGAYRLFTWDPAPRTEQPCNFSDRDVTSDGVTVSRPAVDQFASLLNC